MSISDEREKINLNAIFYLLRCQTCGSETCNYSYSRSVAFGTCRCPNLSVLFELCGHAATELEHC